MPMSIGLARWSDLTEEMLAAIREHAAWKAAEPVNWDARGREDRRSGFDIPYSAGVELTGVLETLCGIERWEEVCFVPYQFDVTLPEEFPPPPEFWKDELHPAGWSEGRTLTLVSARWVHTAWSYSVGEEYAREAERLARRFGEAHEEWRGKGWDAPAPDDFYTAAYHYIEVGLIDVLADGINQGLPVLIYP